MPALEERGDRNLVRGVVRARARCRRAPLPRGPARATGRSRRRPPRTSQRRAPRAGAAERASRRARGRSTRTRSGRACPGSPTCASSAPSRKRTSEWTIEDGCTTTSIASYGTPKSQCASISSSPLFASVAESIVIFGPIRQVGMGERLLRGHVRELVARAAAERPAGRGEDEACDASPVTSLEALVERRVLAVDRQEQASPTLLRGEGELAGGDEALLVRERERDAVLERPECRPDARESDDGVQDDVGNAALQQVERDRRRPGRARRHARRRARPAASSRTGARTARARGARRRSRSPAGRSIRSHRGSRRVSRPQGCLSAREGAVQVRARSATYAAGPAQSSESTRSSTPP